MTDRGFTLLETLVVLVIVGFIMAGLAEGTRFGLGATRTADRWVARDDRQATVEQVLRAVVTNAVAGDGSGGADPMTGRAHAIAFATMLPTPPPGLPIAEADASLAVARGALVLRLVPHYPGAEFGTPRPIELVVADHVDGLDITYWGRGDTGTDWRRSWTGEALPLLVRFHIRPAHARGRAETWPDIVVGPFRMQMPS